MTKKLLKFKQQNELSVASSVIASVIADGTSNKMELTNLNLKPGIYRIYIADFSTNSSSSGHVLRLNDVTSGYQTIHTVSTAEPGTHSNTHSTTSTEAGMLYTNGWDRKTAILFTEATLYYFNKDWVEVTATTACMKTSSTQTTHNMTWVQGGGLMFQNTTSINKISVVCLDSYKIGNGSYMYLTRIA